MRIIEDIYTRSFVDFTVNKMNLTMKIYFLKSLISEQILDIMFMKTRKGHQLELSLKTNKRIKPIFFLL